MSLSKINMSLFMHKLITFDRPPLSCLKLNTLMVNPVGSRAIKPRKQGLSGDRSVSLHLFQLHAYLSSVTSPFNHRWIHFFYRAKHVRA